MTGLRRLGLAGIAILPILGVLLCAAVGRADVRRVYFVIGCSGSVYQPLEIALTCADAQVQFLTPEWESWGPDEASTKGTLRYPACPPRVPLPACQQHAEDEAVIHLRRPVFCPTIGHWQFTRLFVHDLNPKALDEFKKPWRASYTCRNFKPEPPHRLGRGEARNLMRRVLSGPPLGYDVRAGGRIRCNRPITSVRVACTMHWAYGDTGFFGRGQIWLTFQRHEKHAHFSYGLTRVNEYCLFVTKGRHCTKKLRDSGPVFG